MQTVETTHKLSGGNPRSPAITNIGRICGAVGVVLLVSTPLTWLLTAEFGPLVWGKLISGGALVAFYLATNADFFSRVAGARSSGLFAMSALTVVLVLGLVGAANFVAFKNPKEYDFTKEGLYTLSEQTGSLLGRLQTDVHIMAFYPSYDPMYASVHDTLERYHQKSAKLTYEIVDPQNRPDLVEKYQITDRGPRIVVAARGQDARAKEPSEQELTYAIIKVAEQTSKKVFFLTGHGEGDIGDSEHSEGYKAFADAITAEGYGVEALNLQQPGVQGAVGDTLNIAKPATEGVTLQVPANVSALVIGGPRHALLAPEVAALEAYLNRGGRVLLMLEPNIVTGLEGLLKQWKIEARNDVIVDTNPLNRLLGLGAAAPMIQPASQEHPITKDLSAPVVMVTARSLAVLQGGEAGVNVQALAHTGQTAWGETNVGKDGTAARDDKDNLPPLDVAVAAVKPVAPAKQGEAAKLSDEARLAVFGDAEFADNHYLSMQGNQDFALNAINWLAEQEEKIAIRPKNRAGSQLFLSGEQLGKLKFLSMDIMPVLLVAAGLGIVLIRRQR